MAWPGRLFAGDEELGKKDDDHRPSNGAANSASWSVRKPQLAHRRRRIIYAFCALLFVYLFIQNIPTELGPNSLRVDSRAFQGASEDVNQPSVRKATAIQEKKPPRPAPPSEVEEHYHDGPIKFYKLAASLHAAARLGGQKDLNRNVLFAASSLKSVSEMMPLACEMARWQRNDVHMAIMGREEMSILDIMELNGAVEDCEIYWHDARPDFSRWSSDFRMEVSITASLEHIQTFVHPQVIIVDDPRNEDDFFVTAIRAKATELRISLIELPDDATQNMMWLSCLDSSSLAAYPKTNINILIQAPPASSGSLVRLLKSIQGADYFGVRRPHLTIELPAEIDPPTWKYLENLDWPPLDWSGVPHASQVTLRHRIMRRTTAAEEASARLVESFYPTGTKHSHVLLLSSQVELSPLYYQYLYYHLLEYKFSEYSSKSPMSGNIIGISLELPSSFLNDSTPLVPPSQATTSEQADQGPGGETAFLWQAPNSNAALYFGEQWMEFHSFITARLSKPPTSIPKVISEKHPSWLEYLLELMRARGTSLLYPNFPSEEGTLATVHDELYQIPEEFSKEPPSTVSTPPPLSPDDALEANPSIQSRKAPPNTEHPLLQSSLLALMPRSGYLPKLSDLPLVSYEGNIMSASSLSAISAKFADTFRHGTGACGVNEAPTPFQPNSAVDLFCHLDVVYDHHAAAGPMSNGNAPTSKPDAAPDPDVINPDGQASAKDEASTHLERQNKPPPDKNKAPSRPPVKQDSDEDVQSEFRQQMERQGHQAAAAQINEISEPKMEEPPASGEDTNGKKEEEGKRDAFKAVIPKQPTEDKPDGDVEKSPGW